MRKAAITIGVNKAGDLPALDSAAQSALDVKIWLKKQGFAVTAFTDIRGTPVVASKISAKIKKLVDKGKLDKKGKLDELVIFFSGHGFLKDSSEFWMLSGAPADANEAISLRECEGLARDCGIRNITFISDACRSTPGSLRAERVRGQLIFPNLEPDPNVESELDRFMAALPGDAAYEMNLTESTKHYQSIFTLCFLNAFRKPDDDMVREIVINGKSKTVVPSRKLKTYLRREVAAIAQRKSVLYRQLPQSIVESGEDYYLGFVEAVQAPPSPHAPPSPSPRGFARRGIWLPKLGQNRELPSEGGTIGPAPQSIQDVSKTILAKVAPEVFEKPRVKTGSRVEKAIVRDLEKSRKSIETTFPRHFETGAGIGVYGTKLRTVMSRTMDAKLLFEGKSKTWLTGEKPAFIRLYPEAPVASILLRFHDGSGTVIAGLAGYVATVNVENGHVVNVSYESTMYTMRDPIYKKKGKHLARLRAAVAISARHGAFVVSREEARPLADEIRALKGIDPTLGLYAAYAYYSAGLTKEVRSIRDYMRTDLQADIFDIAMLSRDLAHGKMGYWRAPFCPMLSQGWGLLRATSTHLPRVVAEAGEHRRDALWTTFDSEGMDILEAAMTKGELE